MNKIIIFYILLLQISSLNAQNNNSNLKFITIEGFANEVINPKLYRVQVHIRENKKRNNKGIPIRDSTSNVEIRLFNNLSKLGFDSTDLNIQAIKTDELGNMLNEKYREEKVYVLDLKDKNDVIILFENLRFEGLIGLYSASIYPDLHEIENRIYKKAIENARNKAMLILEETGHDIQDMISIEIDLQPDSWIKRYPFYKDYSFKHYNRPAFEFENHQPVLKCQVTISYSYE